MEPAKAWRLSPINWLACLPAGAVREGNSKSTSEEAFAWRDEYAHLLLELEQEVRQYLENEAAFSTGPR